MSWAKGDKIEAENARIPVITSGISQGFEVIDSIQAIASHKPGLGQAHDIEAVFELIKNKLRAKCLELGGDAVINCYFNERSAVSRGLIPAQVIEIWSYGTVVKIVG